MDWSPNYLKTSAVKLPGISLGILPRFFLKIFLSFLSLFFQTFLPEFFFELLWKLFQRFFPELWPRISYGFFSLISPRTFSWIPLLILSGTLLVLFHFFLKIIPEIASVVFLRVVQVFLPVYFIRISFAIFFLIVFDFYGIFFDFFLSR